MGKFSIGDPVMRQRDVYDQRKGFKFGIVIDRESRQSQFGYYPELYRVRWEDGTEEGGFLPHGLVRVGDQLRKERSA
jgi:hypothetical protein